MPAEDEIKDCKTPPGEFRQALWEAGLVCAVALDGSNADRADSVVRLLEMAVHVRRRGRFGQLVR